MLIKSFCFSFILSFIFYCISFTVILTPSTSTTTISLPLSISEDCATTLYNLPSIVALPLGRKTVLAMPFLPTSRKIFRTFSDTRRYRGRILNQRRSGQSAFPHRMHHDNQRYRNDQRYRQQHNEKLYKQIAVRTCEQPYGYT